MYLSIIKQYFLSQRVRNLKIHKIFSPEKLTCFMMKPSKIYFAGEKDTILNKIKYIIPNKNPFLIASLLKIKL